jgi:hypothetical protein
MGNASITKQGTVDGIGWNAQIEATAGGKFQIRGIDVVDRDGKKHAHYAEETASHDDIDGAVAEAEALAKSIAR